MKNNNSHSVKEWTQRADKDFALAQHLFKERHGFEYVCYFCEQAVEKYLKAYIVQEKGGITKQEKIHNLVDLARLCKKLNLDLNGFSQELRMLSAFYTPTRYPVAEAEEFYKKDAKEALDNAKKLINFVKQHLETV